MHKPHQYKLLLYCFVENEQYFGLGQISVVSTIVLMPYSSKKKRENNGIFST